VLRLGGPSIDASMLIPLLVLAVGFALLFGWLLLLRMRTALNERKARALRLYGMSAADGEDSGQPDPAARRAWR
jgi:heme exporter protein C